MFLGFLVMLALYFAYKLAGNIAGAIVAAVLTVAATASAPYLWASAMRFRLGLG